jgi:diguanylate cyclase (GGDEF)-like protein
VSAGGPRSGSSGPEDRSVRRTWRLLAGAFLVLGIVTVVRAIVVGDLLAWVAVLATAGAALAAFLHRNAVAALEISDRAEAESLTRILRGLSRSVSVDAIVGAIVENLADGTGADHVVVVRRRSEGTGLEATLVTRRPGIPNATTVLPLGDLDLGEPGHDPGAVRLSRGIAVGPRPVAAAAGASQPMGARAGGLPMPSNVATIATPKPVGPGFAIRSARPQASGEHLASGPGSAATSRITERVRELYGLSHTLAAPLRVDDAAVGAIILSRRDREPWGDQARRLLRASAVEASAALARAYSHREAAANATTDPLTGLPNRRYFDEFCGLLSRRRRSGDAVAVLMVDIDRFKVLNDTYGHPVGDEVLRAVAAAIVSAVREADVPARIGGEEFAVLLRNPGPRIAAEIGERVREAARALDLSAHGVAGVSVSVGVASAVGPDEPIPAIVERADRALYEAKRSGRDRVVTA